MTLFSLPRSEEQPIEFLQNKHILPSIRRCHKDHNMKIYYGERIQWACSQCRWKVSVRHGTFFESSRISFVEIVRFIYYWSFELSSVDWCSRELGFNKNTTVIWNGFMREVAIADVQKYGQNKIGGQGKIVEIDESLFTKRKNNSGRVLPQQWLFGGICRETSQAFVVQVPNRKADTLFTEIEKHILPGTTIYSDSWKAYVTSNLEKAGFEHLRVNHRYNFVDPTTKAHTQTVERMWGSLKWRNKRHRGTARHYLESYLGEFIWRKLIKSASPFDSILEAIGDYWSPSDSPISDSE